MAKGQATDTQRAVLNELGAMLDELAPAGLDRSRSLLSWSQVSHASEQMAQVSLEHTTHRHWSVNIRVMPNSAEICWLSAHEHVDEDDAWDDRPWTSVVADAVASILRGEYEVEEVTRLGRWYKPRVIDVSDASGPRWLDSSGPLWFWLLRPFPATTTRERIDFTSG